MKRRRDADDCHLSTKALCVHQQREAATERQRAESPGITGHRRTDRPAPSPQEWKGAADIRHAVRRDFRLEPRL